MYPTEQVFCAVKEGSCSPTKSSMADEPAACSPEGAAPGGQQDESDSAAAGKVLWGLITVRREG